KYFGDVLRKEGRIKEAIEYYRKAIDNRRGDFNAGIQHTIGQLYEELEDFDNAVTEYFKVGYIYPDSTRIVVDSQLASARLFEKQKKWQDAERLYKKMSMMDIKESAYAKERLNWIRRNKR
ncbi:MAG: tetratricopeptide repeat protein, partial [Candidatus Omnitrophota bacterium]